MLHISQAKRAFNYNPKTGSFTNKVNRGVGKYCQQGQQAGYKTKKSWRVNIGYKCLNVRKVAWLLNTGKWPQGKIYVLDGDIHNIKQANLTDKSPNTKFNYNPTLKKARLLRSNDSEAILIGQSGDNSIVSTIYRKGLDSGIKINREVMVNTKKLYEYYKDNGFVFIPV